MTFVVRTKGDPASMTAEVQKAIWRVGPDLAIYQIDTMDAIVARNTRSLDSLTNLLVGFGLIALVLALGGLYGVMSFTVGRRTQEIGVRMALGAEARSILRTISSEKRGVGPARGLGRGPDLMAPELVAPRPPLRDLRL